MRKITPKQRAMKRHDDKLRKELLEKHGAFCMRCGAPGRWPGLSLHHKIRKKMGGTTHEYTRRGAIVPDVP